MRSPASTKGPSGSPRRAGQSALILAFLVIVFLPSVGLMVQPHRRQAGGSWQASERRPFPSLTRQWSSILSFPKGFGQYFAANFGFRRNLIRWHTTIAKKVFGKSSSGSVLEGRDGWLFYGDSKTVEDYRGMFPFAPEQLERWGKVLQNRRHWLAAQGIRYLFVVCPDKHSVYSEYMPAVVNRVQPRTRLDQLLQYLKENSTVEVLDLRPALLELKKSRLCYQPQETHWNGIGALTGYQEIVRRLRGWYPDLCALEMADCEVFAQENAHTDLLRLLGRQDILTHFDDVRPIRGFAAERKVDPNEAAGTTYRVMRSTRPEAPIGKLLMFHDSFGIPLTDLLSEHVRAGLYIWSKADRFLAQDVLEYRPDVVIEEILERKLCEIRLETLEESLPALPDIPSSTAASHPTGSPPDPGSGI